LENALDNFLDIFNEIMVMVIGVSTMVLVGFGITVEDRIAQAHFFTYVLYFKLGFNTFMIVRALVIEWKECLCERFMKCRARMQ
jgi:hypothetical protein